MRLSSPFHYTRLALLVALTLQICLMSFPPMLTLPTPSSRHQDQPPQTFSHNPNSTPAWREASRPRGPSACPLRCSGHTRCYDKFCSEAISSFYRIRVIFLLLGSARTALARRRPGRLRKDTCVSLGHTSCKWRSRNCRSGSSRRKQWWSTWSSTSLCHFRTSRMDLEQQ